MKIKDILNNNGEYISLGQSYELVCQLYSYENK